MSQSEAELLLKRAGQHHEPSVRTLALTEQADQARKAYEQHATDHNYPLADLVHDTPGQKLAGKARQAEAELKVAKLADEAGAH